MPNLNLMLIIGKEEVGKTLQLHGGGLDCARTTRARNYHSFEGMSRESICNANVKY